MKCVLEARSRLIVARREEQAGSRTTGQADHVGKWTGVPGPADIPDGIQQCDEQDVAPEEELRPRRRPRRIAAPDEPAISDLHPSFLELVRPTARSMEMQHVSISTPE